MAWFDALERGVFPKPMSFSVERENHWKRQHLSCFLLYFSLSSLSLSLYENTEMGWKTPSLPETIGVPSGTRAAAPRWESGETTKPSANTLVYCCRCRMPSGGEDRRGELEENKTTVSGLRPAGSHLKPRRNTDVALCT